MSTIRGCVFLTFILVVFGQLRTKKPNTGFPCEWEGKNGTCINFWSCATNALDHVSGIHPPVCGFEDGGVNSCCTGCDVVANISETFVVPKSKIRTILEKTGKKYYDNCLSYVERFEYPCTRNIPIVMRGSTLFKHYDDELQCHAIVEAKIGAAVSGLDARREEFPHMALLGYGEDQESAQWLCGGSVISEWYILTAGHCRSAFNGFEVQFAALGILKRSDPPSLWQVYRVDTFIPHPEYRPPSKYHDIALIRTDRHISFSSAVLPVCLAVEYDEWDPTSATGWGQLQHGKAPLADVLQKIALNPQKKPVKCESDSLTEASVPTLDCLCLSAETPYLRNDLRNLFTLLEVSLQAFNETTCFKQYGPSRTLKAGYDRKTQMCYGDAKIGMDTCAGDSGGPLQLDQCPHLLLGVTSAGHPCGFPGSAGLYTRVAAYVPWIESIVWP